MKDAQPGQQTATNCRIPVRDLAVYRRRKVVPGGSKELLTLRVAAAHDEEQMQRVQSGVDQGDIATCGGTDPGDLDIVELACNLIQGSQLVRTSQHPFEITHDAQVEVHVSFLRPRFFAWCLRQFVGRILTQ